MYEDARRYREDRKAKAQRLASGDPHERVDSSDWTPAETISPGKQTGLKPVSKQHLKRGGKVHGEHEHRRADRKQRASGGRSIANAIATVNEKDANKEEFGAEHRGGLRDGGRARARKLYGGPLAPSLTSGYPGGQGSPVPSTLLNFQSGPSQLSKAIGIKSGGRAKRAKGGRIGKFLGGGFAAPGGGMGAPAAGTASPMGATPQVMPNAPQMQFPTMAGANAGSGMQPPQMPQMPSMGLSGSQLPMQLPQGVQNLQSQFQNAQNAAANFNPAASANLSPLTNAMQAHSFGDPDARMRGMIQPANQSNGMPQMPNRAAFGNGMGFQTMGGAPHAKGGKVKNPVYGGTRPTGGRIAKKDGGENWIAGATKNKGALHKKLGVPQGEKIPAKKLAKAEHSKNPRERKEAQLAETLKGLHKAKGGKAIGGPATGDWADRHNYPEKYPNALGKHTHAQLEGMTSTETNPDRLKAVYGELDRRRDHVIGSKRGGEVRGHHAKGGKAKGKMAVNIIIAPGGSRGPNPMMDPSAGAPHPAQPIPMPQPPMMPPGMPMPYPMPGMGGGMGGGMPPPMGGMPMPPPGMPRKRGGRAYAGPTDEKGGSGGGLGRLKKRGAYGSNARGAGPNQAV